MKVIKLEYSFNRQIKGSYLSKALASAINESKKPLLSDYEIFLMVCDIYRAKKTKYLRGNYPSIGQYKRARAILVDARIIDRDQNYPSLWKVVSQGNVLADNIVCVADPYCYISHLSAMQRYGITLRNPHALYITRPTNKIVSKFIKENEAKNNSRLMFLNTETQEQEVIDSPDVKQINHKPKVRGRDVVVKKTKRSGKFIKIKGSNVRIASIGQVFLDMLEDPKKCGGMYHVLEVWDEHASIYLKEISSHINAAGTGIAKVRAGYILSERMGISTDHIQNWVKYVQRGGSRRLDPEASYSSKFSEKWMLSLNV